MISFISQPQGRLTVPPEAARVGPADRPADALALEALETGRAFAEFDDEPQEANEFDLAAWVQVPALMPMPRVFAEAAS